MFTFTTGMILLPPFLVTAAPKFLVIAVKNSYNYSIKHKKYTLHMYICNCMHNTVIPTTCSKLFRGNNGYSMSMAITENMDFQEFHTCKS